MVQHRQNRGYGEALKTGIRHAKYERIAIIDADGSYPEKEIPRLAALLDDADSLAAQGRFGEAIHLLLFRSIDDLAGRRPGVVRPALTSRDIADLDVLPSQPRAAFTRLAQAFERAFFGGQPVGAEVFDAARRDYEAFAFDAGWR